MKIVTAQSVILATSLIGLPVLANSLALPANGAGANTAASYLVAGTGRATCNDREEYATTARPCSAVPASDYERSAGETLILSWQTPEPASNLVASLDNVYAANSPGSYALRGADAIESLDLSAADSLLEVAATAELVVDAGSNAAYHGRGYGQTLRSLLPALLILVVVGLATVSVGFAMRRAFVDPEERANQIPLW